MLGLAFAIQINAQDDAKRKEVGIVFRTLESYAFSFKIGSTESLWRFSAFDFNGTRSSRQDDNSSFFADPVRKSFSLGIRVGREYRKKVDEKITFRYGADLSLRYSNDQRFILDDDSVVLSESKDQSIAYGFNLVLGFNYDINDRFLIGAEVLPFISFNKLIDSDIEGDRKGLSYGLTNRFFEFTLAYKIGARGKVFSDKTQ